MTFPDPCVTDSGVPEVEQASFEPDVARHLARLEADRPVKQPVTPAEERTELSPAEVRVDITGLRSALVGWWNTGTCCEDLDRMLARLDRIEQWVRGQS